MLQYTAPRSGGRVRFGGGGRSGHSNLVNLADAWIASLLTGIIMKHERDDGAQGTVRGSFWVCGTILAVSQSKIGMQVER